MSDQPYPEDPEQRIGRLVAERAPGTNKDQDLDAHAVGTDGGGFAPGEHAMHEETPG